MQFVYVILILTLPRCVCKTGYRKPHTSLRFVYNACHVLFQTCYYATNMQTHSKENA
jgi:hypothetical protein